MTIVSLPHTISPPTVSTTEVQEDLEALRDGVNAVSDANIGTPLSTSVLSDQVVVSGGFNKTGAVRRGYLSIPTEETRTNTALGYMTTEDKIADVECPLGGIIRVRYIAEMKSLTALKIVNATLVIDGSPVDRIGVTANVEASVSAGATNYALLATDPDPDVGLIWPLTAAAPTIAGHQLVPAECVIAPSAAGTYDIGIQFASETGSAGVRVRNRRLWVVSEGYS